LTLRGDWISEGSLCWCSGPLGAGPVATDYDLELLID